MDERLKKLRNHMTSTELKDIRFDDDKKQLVMKRIKNQKRLSQNWVPKGVSIVFSLAIIIIMFFSGRHLLYNSSNLVQGSKENSEKVVNQEGITQSDHTKAIINSNDENTPDLSKEEILYRMLNTNDYFKTAQGSYVSQNPYTKLKVFYKLSMEKVDIGGFEKTVNEQTNSSVTTIVKSDKLLELNEERKEYLLSHISSSLYGDPISLEEVYAKDAHGASITNYRARPPIGGDSLFPFEIAANYLRDESRWEIEQQEGNYLGEKVIVLSGGLNAFYRESHKSVSFKFWVHKATGILMKMETYSAEGNVVDSLETQEFILDKPIPASEFQLNIPKDFKKN